MKFSFGSIKFGVRGEEAGTATPTDETPFRIAILGDFSGKGSRTTVAPGTRLGSLRPLPVDRDNLEAVMARLGVELHVPVGDQNARLTIRFKELDDFRPERIFQQVEIFDKLRQTRRKLSNPATFEAAAAELRTPPPAPSAAPASAAPLPQGEALLDAILGATPQRREAPPGPGGVDLNAFLQKVTSAYLVPRDDPRQAEIVACVDEATGGLMRALLHQTDFQSLEALWRGLNFLVRRLDTDAQLKLFLLDVSRAELAADLASSDDLTATGTYRLLVEQTVGTPGAQPWGLLLGHYSFGPGQADVELLGRLAKVAQRAGAPFLAAASPSVVGCKSFADAPDPDDWQPLDDEAQAAWTALRELPEANYLGLLLPRFLLRRPYGKESDPVEAFDFEEVPEGRNHEGYLWGNPAIAAAYLLGETFSRRGWEMQPGTMVDIDNLPVCVFNHDGDSEVKPCAEVLLRDRAIARIVERGLMALLSSSGRDSVQLAGFRSLSDTNEALAGRWRG